MFRIAKMILKIALSKLDRFVLKMKNLKMGMNSFVPYRTSKADQEQLRCQTPETLKQERKFFGPVQNCALNLRQWRFLHPKLHLTLLEKNILGMARRHKMVEWMNTGQIAKNAQFFEYQTYCCLKVMGFVKHQNHWSSLSHF